MGGDGTPHEALAVTVAVAAALALAEVVVVVWHGSQGMGAAMRCYAVYVRSGKRLCGSIIGDDITNPTCRSSTASAVIGGSLQQPDAGARHTTHKAAMQPPNAGAPYYGNIVAFELVSFACVNTTHGATADLLASLPATVGIAMGWLGQYMFVVPEENLVVISVGETWGSSLQV